MYCENRFVLKWRSDSRKDWPLGQKKRKMNPKRKNGKENGFTILEMMIVMLVIAVLLFITLPNIQQKEKVIRAKGCDSLQSVVNSQIILFEIENDRTPSSMQELVREGYLRENQTACPDGRVLQIVNGQASAQ